MSCNSNQLDVEVYETSASGNKLTKLTEFKSSENVSEITLNPDKTFQKITGFGGSFTESTAYLLNRLSKTNRNSIIQAYFGEEGARYSLTRTHIASCDFSLNNYTYAPIEDDLTLENFSIDKDRDDLIPLIKDAMSISKNGFNIIASPWTAPPWMKDNKAYVGGKLLPEYYDAFALYFNKYLDAYKSEGIGIWGLTPVNEPHGNGNNWESMHFSPEEETDFVQNHLGPKLEAEGKGNIHILGYDQNRAGLKEWVDVMFKDEASSKYYAGTAIHWYESTYDYFPDDLQYAHNKAPNKYLIETEGCVDDEIPKWKDDAWYWKKEATDWGWVWAPEDQKYLHPKYAPVYRYARDIIGCLNNWVDGWIDWNMVLDKQGGPNWFKNWCVAPVIVDPDNDEVYFTPLYYTMTHFSKYIRPGAKVIDVSNNDEELMVTAAQNPDGTIAVVLLNQGMKIKHFSLTLGEKKTSISINPQAIQTITLNNL
ncbi:glycoside hydrolase family 30 protein [Ichthyenterobacterium sp. W332]|uniref:Glycoside hydrolase family 30 protein n=1 Tax=Microcosmobacter mediterraneus TaxID=3075607 RepID=A0ABU2YJW0_9FLAO|nr:glycoside hydrolase family 30 protein [Ichthyenterobacterium sp. W332]MDT0558457.1 glycoside hydrolase family 30 protein [Ichthyenterobacterium sp. W332]